MEGVGRGYGRGTNGLLVSSEIMNSVSPGLK